VRLTRGLCYALIPPDLHSGELPAPLGPGGSA